MGKKKENFIKKAFKDMANNAKAQHEVDKANFQVVKAESKANFEENRGENTFKRAKENAKKFWNKAKTNPSEKQSQIRQEQQNQIVQSQQRIKDANRRIEKAKKERL